MKKKKPFFILQLLLVFAVLIGLLVGPWAFERAKRWQAQRLFDQAQELEASGERQAALQKAEASHRLLPSNDAVLLYLARMSLAMPEPPTEMHDWWRHAMRTPDIRVEDMLHYAEFLMVSGDMRRAYPLIASLRQLAPDNEVAVNLQAQLFLASRQISEADRILSEYVRAHPDASPETRMQLAKTYLRYTDTERRNQARTLLMDLATTEGETRLFALRQIVRMDAFDPAQKAAAAEDLLELEDLAIADHLDAYRALHEAGRMERSEIRDRLIELLRATREEDPDALARVATWLIESGQSQYLLAMIELEEARQDNNLYIARLLAMIQVGQAQAVYDLTLERSDRNPLSQVETLIIRAYALSSLGRGEELEATLNSLVDASEPSTFRLVEQKLLEFDGWEQLLRHYERLRDTTAAGDLARRKLLLAYYYLGREPDLLSLLDEFDGYEDDEDPATRALLSYLNALYGRQTDEALATAENLVTQYPNVIDFRVVLAFNLLRARQLERAENLISNLPPLGENRQRFLKIAMTALERATDGESSAATAPLDTRSENLLPAESNLLRNL